jgi:hypothetical protein
MNHFYAGVLENPAHDIDGGIMAVEKRRRRDNPYMVLGFVNLDLRCHFTSLKSIKNLASHLQPNISRKHNGVDYSAYDYFFLPASIPKMMSVCSLI